MDKYTVWIGNLSYDTSTRSLEKLFGSCGEVRRVFNPYRKGYAFLEFEWSEDARYAVSELDGEALDGRRIRVEPARRRIRSPHSRYDDDRSSYYSSSPRNDDRTPPRSTRSPSPTSRKRKSPSSSPSDSSDESDSEDERKDERSRKRRKHSPSPSPRRTPSPEAEKELQPPETPAEEKESEEKEEEIPK